MVHTDAQPDASPAGAPSSAPSSAPPSAGRAAPVWFVALLPALFWAFHIFVHPLVPCDLGVELAGDGPTAPDASARAELAVIAGRYRISTGFGIAFVAAAVVCVALGLAGVRATVELAFLEACIVTVAYVVHDGMGAFVAPFALAMFLYWPLIAVSKLVRGAVRAGPRS